MSRPPRRPPAAMDVTTFSNCALPNACARESPIADQRFSAFGSLLAMLGARPFLSLSLLVVLMPDVRETGHSSGCGQCRVRRWAGASDRRRNYAERAAGARRLPGDRRRLCLRAGSALLPRGRRPDRLRERRSRGDEEWRRLVHASWILGHPLPACPIGRFVSARRGGEQGERNVGHGAVGREHGREPGSGARWTGRGLFYRKYGFEPTGEVEDGEPVLRLDLAA